MVSDESRQQVQRYLYNGPPRDGYNAVESSVFEHLVDYKGVLHVLMLQITSKTWSIIGYPRNV